MTSQQNTPLSQKAEHAHRFDAVIIGSGFSGMYMLYRLRALGLSVVVLEAADGVGGTWYWNRYPGARCDCESHYYSYSFSDELQQEWNWSERYAAQPEILRYLNHVADRFDLRRDIQFRQQVTGAQLNEETGNWEIQTDSSQIWEAQFLISAVGCLSSSNVPEISGLETFGGELFHTASWPNEGVDVVGKRVGVIGTGSTGIQVIPELAKHAKHVTVFQRTANYSIPARNGPMTESEQRPIKENYSAIRELQRNSRGGLPYPISDRSALEVEEDDRRAAYEAAWEAGGLRFRSTFFDIMLNIDANETAGEFVRSKIRGTVRDQEIAEKLTPDDHPFATKRPPLDTEYFETYNRPNVTLVDLKAEPLVEIRPDGVQTTSATYDLDILVLATGFDAMTGALLNMDIRGTGGLSLHEKWSNGPRTYLGLQVSGFPNMFTITGPGSPAVLVNMPTAIEQHVDWITACIGHLRTTGLNRIEASLDAEDAWVHEVNEAAGRTLLPLAASSWYQGANIPGKPRVFLPYAGGFDHYASLCREIAEADYRGFILTESTDALTVP